MSIEKEDEGRDSPIAQGHIGNNNREDYKKSPEYKKVYHIRHRLQRLVYNKKEVRFLFFFVKQKKDKWLMRIT